MNLKYSEQNTVKYLQKALDQWRSARPGDGNTEFFSLGLTIRKLGFSYDELTEILNGEVKYAPAHSRNDRKRQIPDIIKSLKRYGY